MRCRRGRAVREMSSVTGLLTLEQQQSWSEQGFFRLKGFADQSTCDAMLKRVTDIVRDQEVAARVGAKVGPVKNKAGVEVAHTEDGVSKIFMLHRDDVFSTFATSAPV